MSYADEPCPRCLEDSVKVTRYLYGDDADGNRGIWVEDHECETCGWEPVDGYDFPRCEECEELVDRCECSKDVEAAS